MFKAQDFSNAIVAKMVADRVSLRQVARDLDISPSTISRITRHVATPDVETFARLVKWLGAKPGRFLSLPDDVQDMTNALAVQLATARQALDEATLLTRVYGPGSR